MSKTIHVSLALHRAFEVWECTVPDDADKDWVFDHFWDNEVEKKMIEKDDNGNEIEEIDLAGTGKFGLP
jgi:hypothetical protein